MEKFYNPQYQREFTLPFVGREEDLRFLLNEYDQMLHAQYRSVWIEAPAGVGKTALVEEFLKRLDVVPHSGTTSPLKPWIVHAHLRERSSNSLVSLVEAIGVSLQILPEKEREKLFSGLTSFYEERAWKITRGGNVQSMEMEEAITTAGYILKQLSKRYPVVVVIEDLHVLKGEMSFYALRHLYAILEHVPVMVVYISRPSDGVYFLQFQEQVIKEGCRKYELESLKHEDVEELVLRNHAAVDVKKLMYVSGGNALLVSELLRSGDLKLEHKSGSITERIVTYLQKELGKLPKKDRQVIALAGMLGEEFSEQLLEEITENKNFLCWTKEVLSRLEHRGIIRRRKKMLKSEAEEKEILLRVSVFSHALWWEAARKLYEEEKKATTWSERKFAETIVPLLSHQDYPLLTDMELLVNILHWIPRDQALKLLQYINSVCGIGIRWNLYSLDQRARLLGESHKCVIDLLQDKKFIPLTNEAAWIMVSIINAEQLTISMNAENVQTMFEDFSLISKILRNLLPQDTLAIKIILETVFAEEYFRVVEFANSSHGRTALNELKTLKNYVSSAGDVNLKKYFIAINKLINVLGQWYQKSESIEKNIYSALTTIPWDNSDERRIVRMLLLHVEGLLIPQQELKKFLLLAGNLMEWIKKNKIVGHEEYLTCRVEIELLVCGGFIEQAIEKLRVLSGSENFYEHITTKLTFLKVYSYEFNMSKAKRVMEDILSTKFFWHDYSRRFKWIARSLFYLEEWERINELWKECNRELTPFEMPFVTPLLEARILLCMLHKDNDGEQEALEILSGLSKKFPAMNNTVKFYCQRLSPFFSLKQKSVKNAVKNFDKFLATDTTLSSFDKAHYAQFFARIGVKYGHPAKEFSTYIHFSLQEFEKLKIPKRVVFTAEKFHEVGLLSDSEYKKIIRKHHAAINKDQFVSVSENSESKESKVVAKGELAEGNHNGIRLRCFGEMKAFAPDGKEIISRRWGKREHKPSVYKRIVLELVCAKYKGKTLSRAHLLLALFPEMRQGTVSEKKIRRYNRLLSRYLPQLRNSFLPYQIFEKTDDGFSLHPSVVVDVVEVKKAIAKVKTIKKEHVPSAVWLLTKARNTLSQGEFAKGVHDRSLKAIREEIDEMREECTRLLSSL